MRSIVLAFVLGVGVVAQEPVKAPDLTNEQKQAIVIAVQQVEIWQLRFQQAQAELTKANESAQRVIATACGEGYTVNLQTMTCVVKSGGGGL